MIYRRHSSYRRKEYIPKPMGSRWVAEISRKEDNARPSWRERHGDRTVEDVAIQALRLWVLKECDGCRAQTAEILGISPRNLYTQLSRYAEYGAKIVSPPKDKYRVNLKKDFWDRLEQKILDLGSGKA